MEQTRAAMTQNLAERLCWQVARRDDSRIARRLYRKQVVDGVYQLDEGALLDDFIYFLQELGVGDWPATPACTRWSSTKGFGRGWICGGSSSMGSSLWSQPKRTWR
ncbi:MAG: hypothetical protein HYZ81_11285 [Nitrospinae bacterium]|nr:hypothetical protein [Nitrospinota bacterium]